MSAINAVAGSFWRMTATILALTFALLVFPHFVFMGSQIQALILRAFLLPKSLRWARETMM